MRSAVALLVSFLIFPAALLPDTARQDSEQNPSEIQVEVPDSIVIPSAEKDRKNPVRADAGSVSAGRKLFSTQCAMCHGTKGDGKGDLAVSLAWAVPDFTSADARATRTDGELYFIITLGHGHMPGQGDRLRPAQKWNLTNFIRSLAKKRQASERSAE